jgi:hypothetical protein
VIWIQTHTGRVVEPLRLQPSMIDLGDVAHSLALQCRYAGHTRWHFSIAQHSVLVAKHLPPELARWGMLHDATEAYLVDLPSPVKEHMADYQAFEKRAEEAVAERFGLQLPMPVPVKKADREALATERRDLLGPCERDWNLAEQPWPERIEKWTWELAESTFLAMAEKLGVR